MMNKLNKVGYRILLGLCLICFVNFSFANNIQVANTSLTGRNTASQFTMVQFDLSWENSWRVSVGPSNWDAAWVFVKFQVGVSDPTFTGVSSSGTTITVSSTANLRVGMPISVTGGTGAFSANTVITSITNATQFVVSAAPTTPLSNASVKCFRIWEHAHLNNTGHTAPSGSTIDAGLLTPGTAFNVTSNPAVGVFIYRNTDGIGANYFTNTQLRWNYGANGVPDNAVVSVKVFALEMVFVPQGNFYLGSGGTDGGSFTDGSWGSGATIPFQITSENALSIAPSAGNLWGISSTIGGTGTLSASYPKGFSAFYMMKYEISQQQYADFLNVLTRVQQNNRTAANLSIGVTSVFNRFVMTNTSILENRCGLRVSNSVPSNGPITFYCDGNVNGIGGEANDGQWLAMNYLNWKDGAAFMDWSGLRPMTELEYEKACRGSLTPVPNEYAWGTSSIAATPYTLGNPGTAEEGIASNFSTTAGNANYISTIPQAQQGPLRVGVFSANPSNTGRVTSGASYWGIMELSGNLWERAVTVGNTDGRNYTGIHGDGFLSSRGFANVNAWPGLIGTEVSGSEGSGYRGGSIGGSDASFLNRLRVSDRGSAVLSTDDRDLGRGFRGVRSWL